MDKLDGFRSACVSATVLGVVLAGAAGVAHAAPPPPNEFGGLPELSNGTGVGYPRFEGDTGVTIRRYDEKTSSYVSKSRVAIRGEEKPNASSPLKFTLGSSLTPVSVLNGTFDFLVQMKWEDKPGTVNDKWIVESSLTGTKGTSGCPSGAGCLFGNSATSTQTWLGPGYTANGNLDYNEILIYGDDNGLGIPGYTQDPDTNPQLLFGAQITGLANPVYGSQGDWDWLGFTYTNPDVSALLYTQGLVTGSEPIYLGLPDQYDIFKELNFFGAPKKTAYSKNNSCGAGGAKIATHCTNSAYQYSTIPLPAGVWLLLMGTAGFGLIGLNRRRSEGEPA